METNRTTPIQSVRECVLTNLEELKKVQYAQTELSVFENMKTNNNPKRVTLASWIMATMGLDEYYNIYVKTCLKAWDIPNKKERDAGKQYLPIVIGSVLMNTREQKVALVEKVIGSTKMIFADLDNIACGKDECPDDEGVQKLEDAKRILSELPYVIYAGYSYSRHGLVVVIFTDNDDYTQHPRYWQAVTDALKEYGFENDEATKDVTRCRFFSYDPHPYINAHAEPFTLSEGTEVPLPEQKATINDYLQFTSDQMKDVISCVEQFKSKADGSERFIIGKGTGDGSKYRLMQDMAFALQTLNSPNQCKQMLLDMIKVGRPDCDEAEQMRYIDEFFSHPKPDRHIRIGRFFEIMANEWGIFPEFRSPFKTRTMRQRMIDASILPIPKNYISFLLVEGETVYLAAENNVGKSILGMQMMVAITEGKDFLGLRGDDRPTAITLYFDFELSDKAQQKRYSEDFQNNYQFNELFYSSVIDGRVTPPRGMDKAEYIRTAIAFEIKRVGAKVVIIDNVTKLCESFQSFDDVKPLLEWLQDLSHNQNIAVLVMAHTTKSSKGLPLNWTAMRGAGSMADMADAMFAVGYSRKGDDYRYIKQLKSGRLGDKVLTENNVLECRIVKNGNFTEYVATGYGTEADNLPLPAEVTAGRTARNERVQELHNQGMTPKQIQQRILSEFGEDVKTNNICNIISRNKQ